MIPEEPNALAPQLLAPQSPWPDDEAGRLRDLWSLETLDMPGEAAFDGIAEIAAERFDAPIPLWTLRSHRVGSLRGIDAIPRKASITVDALERGRRRPFGKIDSRFPLKTIAPHGVGARNSA